MKIVLEIDDDELRRLLVPLLSPRTPQAAMSPGRLLTVRDVADQLGISRNKAYELIFRGQIESLAIGRLRRVSPAALAKFIASPAEPGRPPNQPIIRPRSVSPPRRSPSSATKEPTHRRPKIRPDIDLMPKPVAPETGPELTDDEWEQIFGQLKEHGWPEDVVEQVRGDRKEGITRTYVLRVSDAARYLGLSRSALDKLVSVGKLRISTIRSQYRDGKAEKLIPAKDVLALK
jgi:excisionase family DNA binding protein